MPTAVQQPDNGHSSEDDDKGPQQPDLLPAEHLERNDDLCSSVLVDQIGCDRLHEARLGVHHQQAKFVGPPIPTGTVLNIIRYVIYNGSLATATALLLELPVMRDHLATKRDKKRREEAINHIGLYLQIYKPTSRVEIWRTDRYTEVSGHSELGVFATAVIPASDILIEIQGQCADIPDEWIPNNRTSSDDSGSEDETCDRPTRVRRSMRNGRRDFSIIRSNRHGRTQLFLGPARFINHDCNPNVELTVIGKNKISFRSRRRIMIGEELTTTYGDHYFDRNNCTCMCLTCEKGNRGYFTPKPGKEVLVKREMTDSEVHDEDEDKDEEEADGGEADGGEKDEEEEEEEVEDDEEEEEVEDDEEEEEEEEELFDKRRRRRQTPRPQYESDGGVSELECASPTSALDDMDGDAESASTSVRYRPFRQVRNNARKLDFSKRQRLLESPFVPQRSPVDDPEAARCITCVDALRDRYWSVKEGKWDDFCPRCTRHALIYKMPWPAHSPDQINPYPPGHLIPINYVAKNIHSVPLPGLELRKKTVEPEGTAGPSTPGASLPLLPSRPPPTKVDRAHWKLLARYQDEDAAMEQQRLLDWNQQVAHEERLAFAARQREEAKRKREEEKKKRAQNKIRGTGLWTAYELVSQEELERRIRERNTVVTGTRSGRRFANPERDEQEILLEAQRRLNLEREQEAQLAERRWRKNQEQEESSDEESDVATPEDDVDAGASGHDHEMLDESEPLGSPVAWPDSPGPSKRPSTYVASRKQAKPQSRTRSERNGSATAPYDLTAEEIDSQPLKDYVDMTGDSDNDVVSVYSQNGRNSQPCAAVAVPVVAVANPVVAVAAPVVAVSVPVVAPPKRGPGRPRGSGPKQIREKRRAERNRRAQLEKEEQERRAKAAMEANGESVDEASPYSVRDDVDSQHSFGSDDLDAPSPASSRSSKRKRPSETTREPRHFFKRKSINLPKVSADGPPPGKAVFTGPM